MIAKSIKFTIDRSPNLITFHGIEASGALSELGAVFRERLYGNRYFQPNLTRDELDIYFPYSSSYGYRELRIEGEPGMTPFGKEQNG